MSTLDYIMLGVVGLAGALIVGNWKQCQTVYSNVSKTGIVCAPNDLTCAAGGTVRTTMNPVPNLACLLNPFPGGF
jgi:hypothetical protein